MDGRAAMQQKLSQWLWSLPGRDVNGPGGGHSSPDIDKLQASLLTKAGVSEIDLNRSPLHITEGSVIKPRAVHSAFSTEKKEALNDEKQQPACIRQGGGGSMPEVSAAFRVPPHVNFELLCPFNELPASPKRRSHDLHRVRDAGDDRLRIIFGGTKEKGVRASPWKPYYPQTRRFVNTSVSAAQDKLGGSMNRFFSHRNFDSTACQFGFSGASSLFNSSIGSSDRFTDDRFGGPPSSSNPASELQHALMTGDFEGNEMAMDLPPLMFEVDRSLSIVEPLPLSSPDWTHMCLPGSSVGSLEQESLDLCQSGVSAESMNLERSTETPGPLGSERSLSKGAVKFEPQEEIHHDAAERSDVLDTRRRKFEEVSLEVPVNASAADTHQTLACSICIDCGKQFQTPQALGGHMSSHRRSKLARSRQLSPSSGINQLPPQFGSAAIDGGNPLMDRVQSASHPPVPPPLLSGPSRSSGAVPPPAAAFLLSLGAQLRDAAGSGARSPLVVPPSVAAPTHAGPRVAELAQLAADSSFAPGVQLPGGRAVDGVVPAMWQSLQGAKGADGRGLLSGALDGMPSDLHVPAPPIPPPNSTYLAGRIVQIGGRLYRLRPIEQGSPGPATRLS